MLDVSPTNADSGIFVDLSKLNTINVPKTYEFSMTDTNSRFELVNADEYIQIYSKVFSSKTESQLNEEKNEYNNDISKIVIKNGKFYSKDGLINLMYKIKIKSNEIGKYSLSWQYPREFINKKSIMDTGNYELDPNTIISDLGLDEASYTVKGNMNVTEEDTYYFAVSFSNSEGSNGISLIQDNPLKLNGDENITLLPTDVSSYKDAGVSYNGKTLTGNDVYSYTNLKDKEGDYKYIYVVKTNQGVKIFRRYITVGLTSEKCFKFNKDTQEIEQYYFVENNVSGGNKCPMNVVIPEKISGVQVKSIGEDVFRYGCNKNVVKSTSSNNKYEIKKIRCSYMPIGINSVILPEGLENISYRAFEGNNLKTVTIPSTVTTIDGYAFYNNLLQKVTFKGDKSKILIGCYAFEGEKHSDSVNAIKSNNCVQ